MMISLLSLTLLLFEVSLEAAEVTTRSVTWLTTYVESALDNSQTTMTLNTPSSMMCAIQATSLKWPKLFCFDDQKNQCFLSDLERLAAKETPGLVLCNTRMRSYEKPCPAPFEKTPLGCIYFEESKAKFSDARSDCQKLDSDADLANADGPNWQQDLSDYLTTKGYTATYDIWIGLWMKTKADGLEFVLGGDVNTVVWNVPPSTTREPNCVRAKGLDGYKLDDMDCSSAISYLCQIITLEIY